jgi:transcription initiation factor TFIID subunit 6
MSAINTILTIADELGLVISEFTDLSNISRDSESYVSSILELASRIRRHKGQFRLRVSDINESLSSKGFPILLGYRSTHSPRFFSVGEFDGLEIRTTEDHSIPLSSFRGVPLKPYPTGSTLDFHWLAINGIQPQIEQNVIDRPAGFIPDTRLRGPPPPLQFTDPSVVLVSSKSLVPQHLQDYFLRAQDVLRKQGNSNTELQEYKLLIDQLSTDAAFQPLVPFFIRTAWDHISSGPRSLPQLMMALNICRALFQNQNLECESNLGVFISIALTLMIAGTLGDDPFDELCSLRENAADFLGLVVHGSQPRYPDLIVRTAGYLLAVLLDERCGPTSQYGAAVGLLRLGCDLVRELLIPHLSDLLERLQAGLAVSDPQKRLQARHLYGVLARICGICFHKEVATGTMDEQSAETYKQIHAFFGNDLFEFAHPQ